jgi:hypothetical protein
VSECSAKGCEREARMTVHTTRPSRAVMKSVVHYDDRTAPKSHVRYCKEHGKEIVAGLVDVLADVDEEAT